MKSNRLFPFIKQRSSQECGIACLCMIFKHYRRTISPKKIANCVSITSTGISISDLCISAKSMGMKTLVVKINYDELLKDALLPCIVHLGKKHFVVAYGVNEKGVDIADPSNGRITYSRQKFIESWAKTRTGRDFRGNVIFLEPSNKFKRIEHKNKISSRNSEA
jgi:ATP-binding cassette subfamily B protein